MHAGLITTLLPDWQTLVSFGLGLVALVYVGRRWWPALAGLLGLNKAQAPAAAGLTAGSAGPCGQPATTATTAGACQSGCGHCGQSTATPSKDHRVHITRRSAY